MQTLSSLIANYLETGQYEKQLSPHTIKAYRIDLQQFSDFMKGAWADKDMLNRYIKYLNQHFTTRWRYLENWQRTLLTNFISASIRRSSCHGLFQSKSCSPFAKRL